MMRMKQLQGMFVIVSRCCENVGCAYLVLRLSDEGDWKNRSSWRKHSVNGNDRRGRSLQCEAKERVGLGTVGYIQLNYRVDLGDGLVVRASGMAIARVTCGVWRVARNVVK